MQYLLYACNFFRIHKKLRKGTRVIPAICVVDSIAWVGVFITFQGHGESEKEEAFFKANFKAKS
jgi:hypothetical protein